LLLTWWCGFVFSGVSEIDYTAKYANKEAVFERITYKLSLVELNTGGI